MRPPKRPGLLGTPRSTPSLRAHATATILGVARHVSAGLSRPRRLHARAQLSRTSRARASRPSPVAPMSVQSCPAGRPMTPSPARRAASTSARRPRPGFGLATGFDRYCIGIAGFFPHPDASTIPNATRMLREVIGAWYPSRSRRARSRRGARRPRRPRRSRR